MSPLRREPVPPSAIDGGPRRLLCGARGAIRRRRAGSSLWSALLIAAVCVAVLAGAGCRVDRVATAPFRRRPDSVAPGDLRGPFTGRVRDASTGDPVAGALVYATWTLESGYGFEEPAGYRQYVTSTDAGGRYKIPRQKDLPLGGSTRLARFHLVIYKRGYVAYRSDRRFSDLGLRTSFTQKMNHVALQKWQPSYSHARHLRYVGGGAALSALTAWEVDDAAAELSGEHQTPTRLPTELGPITSPGGEVVAARILQPKDVIAVTGFSGKFESGPLGDQPDTPSYSSQHFRALNLPESYDVALRLWKLAPRAAEERYSNLLDTLPKAKETDDLADRSLRASEAQIYGVAFLDKTRGVVGLLTCGKSLCTSHDTAVELARKVYGHVVALWPAGQAGSAAGGSAGAAAGNAATGKAGSAPAGKSARKAAAHHAGKSTGKAAAHHAGKSARKAAAHHAGKSARKAAAHHAGKSARKAAAHHAGKSAAGKRRTHSRRSNKPETGTPTGNSQ